MPDKTRKEIADRIRRETEHMSLQGIVQKITSITNPEKKRSGAMLNINTQDAADKMVVHEYSLVLKDKLTKLGFLE